jgi:DUF917 family protein
VQRITIQTKGGFDLGQIDLQGGYELTFWNEYMTLEREGQHLATFPDLIATLATDKVRPLPSAEVQEGQKVLVIRVPKERLRLGAGMRQAALFHIAEEAVGKELIRYL